MKNLLRYIKQSLYIVILLIAAMAVSCTEDPTIDDDGTVSELYGNDKRVVLAHDLSSYIPVGDILVGLYADGVTSVVEAEHTLEAIGTKSGDEQSVITFAGALNQNDYQLHFVEYYLDNVAVRKNLGTCLSVGSESNTTYPDNFDTEYQFFGDGTADNPFQVNSIYAFDQLSADLDNGLETAGVYFEMNDDVVMDPVFEDFYGVSCDSSKPFEGIFNGNGYTIYNLILERFSDQTVSDAWDAPCPVGLFNFISGATIENVNIDSPRIVGNIGVGALVGAVLGQSGYDMYYSNINYCSISSSSDVTRSTITGQLYVGGLVGMVNTNAGVYLDNCESNMADSHSLNMLSGTSASAQYFGGLIILLGFID